MPKHIVRNFFCLIALYCLPLKGQTDIESGLTVHYPFNHDLGSETVPNDVEMDRDRFGNPLSSISFDNYLENLQLDHTTVDGLSDMSISIWFKSTVGGVFFSAANSSRNNEVLIQVLSDGKLAVNIRNNPNIPGIFISGTTDVRDGNWHHLVVVRNGESGFSSMYLDGALEASGTMPSDQLSVDSGGLFLGNDQDCVGGCWEANNQFYGKLDDLRIYNRQVSQDEILALFNIDETVTSEDVDLSADLNAHYDFNNRLTDQSPNSHHASDHDGDFIADQFSLESNALFYDSFLETTKIPDDVMDGLSDLSISIWFKSSIGGSLITAANNARNNEFIPQILTTGVIAVNIRNRPDRPGIRVDGATNVLDNQWHHLVILREGTSGTTTLYLDGVHEATGNMPIGDLEVGQDGLYLGNDQDVLAGGWSASNQFFGSLDDFWVFERIINIKEIEALGNPPSKNNPPTFSLSGNLDLDEDFDDTQTVIVTPAAVTSYESGETVVYSISPTSADFATLSFNSQTGKASFTAVENASGTQQFTITADDGQTANSTASQIFDLTVSPVNDAPGFTVSDDIVVDEDFGTNPTVTVTPDTAPDDESGQTVTYSISPTTIDFATLSFDSQTGEARFTATENANGTQRFTITADDGQAANNTATKTFNLTVNPVNDAPEFTVSDDIIVDEDFETNPTITVTPSTVPDDESGQSVTYSISPTTIDFATLSFDSQTGEASFTATQNGNGTQQFTITADDGQETNNTATKTFNLTVNAVNDAPGFTVSDDIEVDEDFETIPTITVSPITAPDDESGQTVTYSISPASVDFATLSFDSQTGEASFTAIENGNGTQQFTITADDGQASNNTATKTFNLTVNAVNDAPEFTVSDDIVVDEDFQTNPTITVAPSTVPDDESGQSVTYSISPTTIDFATLSFDSQTGEASFTATQNGNGTQQFTITADDGQETNNTATKTFNLTVNAVNDAPEFTVSDDIVVDEDFETNPTVTVTPGNVPDDESGQTVTYSISPTTIDFATFSFDNQTGEASFTVIENGNGTQQFTITADDGQEANNTATKTFNFTVNAVNDAPEFTISDDVVVDEDFEATPLVTVTPGNVPDDESGQTVSYSISPVTIDFATLDFNSQTGEASFTAIDNANGTQEFTITADDGQGVNNTATKTFSFTVNAINDAPVIASIEDQSIEAGLTLTLTVSVADVESDLIELTASSDNTDLIGNSALEVVKTAPGTFSLSISPDIHKFGSTVIRVSADDGQATTASQFALAVEQSTVTSIEDLELSRNIIISPNPTSGRFKLEYAAKSERVVKYRLIGPDLKSVLELEATMNHTQYFDLSGLPAGIYVLQVLGNQGVAHKKILKQ